MYKIEKINSEFTRLEKTLIKLKKLCDGIKSSEERYRIEKIIKDTLERPAGNN